MGLAGAVDGPYEEAPGGHGGVLVQVELVEPVRISDDEVQGAVLSRLEKNHEEQHEHPGRVELELKHAVELRN